MPTSGTSEGAALTYTIYTREEGQLPNPNEWNSMLTSATREEMLTTGEEGQLPNPNEWNSTIMSATKEEMLTLVRIAKRGWRTGAVRIATAFLKIASNFLVNIQNIFMFAK